MTRFFSFILGFLPFFHAIKGSSCLVVRLASWNVLAPTYAKPSKYPWCAPEHLDWAFRKKLIVPQLLKMDADIICLQEIQVDVWPDLLGSLEATYDGILQNVTRGHTVASALLLRKSCPLQIERIESRSRALLTVLRDPRTKSHLYLGNVHLEAGSTHDDNLQRYYQLKSLFKRLMYQCQEDKVILDEAPIVLAGDFNMIRTNPLHTFLSQGLLQNPEQVKNQPPTNTIQLYDAYLDPTVVKSKQSKLHYNNDGQDRRQLSMTYRTGYVLDYVWTSRKLQIDETYLFHPGASTKEPQKWPSQDHPSDHLPIGVDLDWQ